MNRIRTAFAAAALAALAACSYSLPEGLVLRIFEQHSLVRQDPAKLAALMKAKGADGLKEIDPYAAVVKADLRVKTVEEDAQLSAGMILGRDGARLRVLRAFRGGPAAAAGLSDGDVVLSADGAAPGTPEFEAALANREFTLKAERRTAGGAVPVEAKVRKARFAFPGMFGVYDPQTRTAYVRIPIFLADSSQRVADGLDTMVRYGARNVVFDLRGNKGGSPQDAAELLAMLTDKPGRMMSVESRDKGYGRVYSTTRRGRYAALRPAVLTDGATAMAAEVFAASLKELRGARVIGVKTAGSVWVQNTFRLTGGRGLRLTVASLATANGADLEGKGLAPDEQVETPADAARAWKAALPSAFMTDPAYARAAELFKK